MRGIAGKAYRIARYIGDGFQRAFGQLGHLRLGAGAGRVDHGSVKLVQLIHQQRTAKEIACLMGEFFQSLGPAPTGIKGGGHFCFALDRVHFGPAGKRQ